MLQLPFPLDAEQKLSMLVVAQLALLFRHPDACDVDIPAIDVVALGQVMQNARVDGIGVHDLDFGKPDTLFEARGSRNARYHHELDQLARLDRQLPPFRLLQSVFGGRYSLAGKRL